MNSSVDRGRGGRGEGELYSYRRTFPLEEWGGSTGRRRGGNGARFQGGEEKESLIRSQERGLKSLVVERR